MNLYLFKYISHKEYSTVWIPAHSETEAKQKAGLKSGVDATTILKVSAKLNGDWV